MLQIDKLTVSYKNKKVIKELSYTFEDGKHYAITGTSGIGKTTLINALAGLKRASGGRITSTYLRPAYIFQEPRLFPWLTVLENVTAVCNDEKKARELIKSLIRDEGVEDKYPDELSGGMRQRVAVARALAYDFDIIFMDEPHKGLDEKTLDEVRRIVFEHIKGKTAIIVTHDRGDALLCDEILNMSDYPVTSLVAEESGSTKSE